MGEGVQPRSQRVMRNILHHVELERPQSQALAFRVAGGPKDPVRVPMRPPNPFLSRNWTPSTQLSRGSFRSDLSGASVGLHASRLSSPFKSSQQPLPPSFVQSLAHPYPAYLEQMRSASAATLSATPTTDLSLTRRPVSAFEESPVARPSPFPRTEPMSEHIYANQLAFQHQSASQLASSHPFARTLVLRDSQRRRFDHRIAQIRRERQAAARNLPPTSPPVLPPLSPSSSESGDERLCQV